MNLNDLIGPHTLDAVDRDQDHDDSDANCLVFRLDGIAYASVEDEDDGYRSSMKDLKVWGKPMRNTFPPQNVICTMSSVYDQDILEITCVKSGKVVLRTGTDQCDDYYPMFVDEWKPDNFADRLHAV